MKHKEAPVPPAAGPADTKPEAVKSDPPAPRTSPVSAAAAVDKTTANKTVDKAAPKAPDKTADKADKQPSKVDPRFEALSNETKEFGSGYYSWGTRGGATLGAGSGARLEVFAGTHFHDDGFGNIGICAMYVAGISKNFDMSFGLRAPFWPLGVAPGIEAHFRIYNGGPFQLGLHLGAFGSIVFKGFFGGLGAAISAEPALMASYFIRDNQEIIFGIAVPITPTFLPATVFQIGFAGRVGYTYVLKKSNLGFYLMADVAPGFYAIGGYPTVVKDIADPVVQPSFSVVVNFTLGMQFRF